MGVLDRSLSSLLAVRARCFGETQVVIVRYHEKRLLARNRKTAASTSA